MSPLLSASMVGGRRRVVAPRGGGMNPMILLGMGCSCLISLIVVGVLIWYFTQKKDDNTNESSTEFDDDFDFAETSPQDPNGYQTLELNEKYTFKSNGKYIGEHKNDRLAQGDGARGHYVTYVKSDGWYRICGYQNNDCWNTGDFSPQFAGHTELKHAPVDDDNFFWKFYNDGRIQNKGTKEYICQPDQNKYRRCNEGDFNIMKFDIQRK
tara:strand:- start:1293 stop:1922 length:630 start_codon:yes stop_codon:yes gene_type:complete